MLFIDNKYTRLYYSIISKAQSRVLEKNIYSEKHHIIPKSIGGTNLKDNLVLLTAREHFIAHWLLTKMVENKKHKWQMWNAFHCMLYRETDNQQRYKVTGRIFENIKRNGSTIKSERFSGESNPMFGKKHSEESKRKMSKERSGKGKPHTNESKAKISKANTGIVRDAEFRANVSKVHKGKVDTAETRLKKSVAQTGKKWVNNGVTSKRVFEVENGWVLGRISKKNMEGMG